MKLTSKHTLFACCVGFIIQSIVNNFAPLLFALFSREFGLSMEELTLLVTFNFGAQMVIDFLGARYADKMDSRAGMIAAHAASAVGLAGLGILPMWMNPLAGLLIATAFCALGSGLIEVLASPMVEALPTDEKSAKMSILHSFFCWGQVLVVLLSTAYFAVFGEARWSLLPILWALVPALNLLWFIGVPIYKFRSGDETVSPGRLFGMPGFVCFLLLMFCGGAAEQVIAQWASLFAETGLGVSKTVGDLLGPCLFGLMMAASRTFYGIRGGRIPLRSFMTVCSAGLVFSFLLTVFAPHPFLSLIGCGLTGLFAGIFWPGTLSLATSHLPKAGASMFGVLALAGDIGCAAGPGVAGIVSGMLGEGNAAMRGGILVTIVFPVTALIVMLLLSKKTKEKNSHESSR